MLTSQEVRAVRERRDRPSVGARSRARRHLRTSSNCGFPTLQDEDWRFTNVAPIAKLPFEPVFEPTRDAVTAQGARSVHLRRAERLTARLCERPLRAGAFLGCQAAGRREGDEPCGRARQRYRGSSKSTFSATLAPSTQRLRRAEHRVLPGRRVHLRAARARPCRSRSSFSSSPPRRRTAPPPIRATSSWPSRAARPP